MTWYKISQNQGHKVPGVVFEWGEVQYDDKSEKSLHAKLEGKIIGFIDLYKLPTGEYGVGQLTVVQEFQRKGIATALWNKAKQDVPNLVLHSYDATEDGEAWMNAVYQKGLA
jgi:ribosomal protein S18 acetylase RimI-like enzyme